jgi:hypothetical protein
MNNKNLAKLKVALAALVLVTLACVCGSSNSGQKVGEATTTSPNSAPAQATTYKVGDIVQVGDGTIVLNSAALQGGKLQANFTIENKGTTDMNVSSLLSFTAKDSEGTKLESNFMDCGSSSLDGKILPNDKLKGDVCWQGATTNSVKIYYEAELFGSGAIVWEITQ